MEAGYYAVLTDCQVKDQKIEKIFVTTEEGVYAIEAEQFVDATGDAVLSRMAGVAYTAGDENGNNQMTSLRFEMGGIDVEKYRAYCLSLNDEFSPLVKGYFFESAMCGIRILNLNRFFEKGWNLDI